MEAAQRLKPMAAAVEAAVSDAVGPAVEEAVAAALAVERAALEAAHKAEVEKLVHGAQQGQLQLQQDCERLLSEAREQLRTREARLSALAARWGARRPAAPGGGCR